MSRLFTFSRQLAWLSLVFTALAGCASGQFPTLTIYDSPHAFVRLETDRAIWQHTEYSHPANISTEQMMATLRGIIVQEPLIRLPLYDDLSVPRRHRAFDDKAVMLLAPLLSQALHKATSEELVTFYQSRPLSGVAQEVTSGGVFLIGENLHFILSNYRSNTRFTADTGSASTLDDRLTPMQPLAPQQVQLDFEPSAALEPKPSSLWMKILQTDKRELIIRSRQLMFHPQNETPTEKPVSTDTGR
ncbi:MAG: hypothetical protein HOP22_05745 [Nitrospiraceae bacterium]|jgi:hypothetical protein|nr:hypothetical protein [Nitrospiraceae bacterium]